MPYINKYNKKEINYSSGKYDWENFEKNNPSIPHNVLYIKELNIYPACISEHRLSHEK